MVSHQNITVPVEVWQLLKKINPQKYKNIGQSAVPPAD